MSDSKLYSEGSRRLQDHFDTWRIADRLEKVDLLEEFTDQHRAIIEAAPMFFLATADAQGRPDVSYKGGLPGFVRVVGPSTLAFPGHCHINFAAGNLGGQGSVIRRRHWRFSKHRMMRFEVLCKRVVC